MDHATDRVRFAVLERKKGFQKVGTKIALSSLS